jgi:hypothetical protein
MYEQGPDTGVDRGYSEEREPEGITVERVREMAGFMVRATRRHIKLAIVTFFVVAGAGVGIAWTMPKVYSARVKLLAQRSSAIRVLSSPNPGMEAADNPTRNIAATILSRDNLVALAKDAKLVERFDETRPSALKLKDRLMDHLFSPPTAEDKLLRMVFTLEKQLEVTVDDANVTITVTWPTSFKRTFSRRVTTATSPRSTTASASSKTMPSPSWRRSTRSSTSTRGSRPNEVRALSLPTEPHRLPWPWPSPSPGFLGRGPAIRCPSCPIGTWPRRSRTRELASGRPKRTASASSTTCGNSSCKRS